jgi:hypothetical protein
MISFIINKIKEGDFFIIKLSIKITMAQVTSKGLRMFKIAR